MIMFVSFSKLISLELRCRVLEYKLSFLSILQPSVFSCVATRSAMAKSPWRITSAVKFYLNFLLEYKRKKKNEKSWPPIVYTSGIFESYQFSKELWVIGFQVGLIESTCFLILDLYIRNAMHWWYIASSNNIKYRHISISVLCVVGFIAFHSAIVTYVVLCRGNIRRRDGNKNESTIGPI